MASTARFRARPIVSVLLSVVALLAALLAARLVTGGAAGAPWSAPARAAGAAGPAAVRIRMFGDSVMLGARDDLMAAFPGSDTSVDAVENRSLLGTTPVLVAHPELLGDVVVLDLGYNDMADPAVFHDRVEAMMQALATVPRVVWLTQSLFQPPRAAMNDELRAAAARHPNLDVVDWDAQVQAHPEYVYADGLHLTVAGRSAFAAAVKNRVDTYLDAHRESATAPSATHDQARTPASTPARTAPATTPAERQAAKAAPPTVGPTGRTVAAVAIGLVALVVLAGVVLLRRAGTGAPYAGDADPLPDHPRRQRPVPAHRSHSGAPPVA